MTPFMIRVADLVGAPDGLEAAELAPMPTTRLSERMATGTGADRHVAVRSMAEQYICEANAVLGPARNHLGLVDETLAHELAFTVTYGDQGARCSMVFADGRAYGQLVGTYFDSESARELEGPDALPDLLVRLIRAGTSTAAVHPTA